MWIIHFKSRELFFIGKLCFLILAYTEAIYYLNPMLDTGSQPYGTKFQKSSSNVSSKYLSTVLSINNLREFNRAASQAQPGWRLFYWDLPPVKNKTWILKFLTQYLSWEHNHTLQNARNQMMGYFFSSCLKKGTTFPSEIPPCRCTGFAKPN